MLSNDIFNECDGKDEKLVELGDQTYSYSARAIEARTGINPLVMEQGQMRKAKWKELREEYNDGRDYSDDNNEMMNLT